MIEPKIQIGKYVLTEAQAMAVRVAVTGFHMECVDDEDFRKNLGLIADAYAARLSEVLKIMLTEARDQSEDTNG